MGEVAESASSEQSSAPYWNSGNKSQPPSKFFKISGYVSTIITDDKMVYQSCPDCRRKVVDDMAGFRCENCNKVHTSSVPTYMLTAKLSDVSGSLFIQFPRDLGDSIMNGMSAKQLMEFKETHRDIEEVKELTRSFQFTVSPIPLNVIEIIATPSFVEGE